MKRFLTILFAVITLISMLAMVGFSTYATDIDPTIYVNGDYSYVVLGNTDAKIVAYSGNATDLQIPEKIGKYKVTYIDDFAFLSNSFSTVIVPKTVISIGESAFVDCENLTEISILHTECEIFDSEYTIPENVSIKGYDNSTAFEYAQKYEKIFISLGEAPTVPTTESPSETESSDEPTTPSESQATGDQITPSETESSEEPTIPFEPILPPYGDVDLDGVVSIMDATAIQLHLANISTIEEDILIYADTDKDEVVSIMDATSIQLSLAQLA